MKAPISPEPAATNGTLVPNGAPNVAGRRVVLVNMPFAAPSAPSIGLGILKAQLERAGARCAVLDLNLDFATRIGDTAYRAVSEEAGVGVFAGEWIFSDALFDRHADPSAFIRDILDARHPDQPYVQPDRVVESVLMAREATGPFLDAAADLVLSFRPDVVGFTSMFQQHVAALALARRLKRRVPELPVMLGGPNCDGTMGAETARSFPVIDAVVLGEAEEVILPLVAALCDGRDPLEVPGVVTPALARRDFDAAVRRYARRITDMDRVPAPDYSDYFASRDALGLGGSAVTLPFESSRGCWWGEKHHCVFCGINPHAMPYRAKSVDRTLDELRALRAAYPGRRISAVDNILSTVHARDLLPRLAEERLGLEMFYEIKSNLRDDQIRALREAGIIHVQPGIESLDTEILSLMRKGVTGAQNIQLLKSCETHGVSVYWNFIWGFPGEPAAAYDRMRALAPSLWHLPAPGMGSRILLNRFSPHYNDSGSFGFRNVRPFPAYRHIYALPPDRVANLAYYFCYDYADGHASGADDIAMSRVAQDWQGRQETAFLFHASIAGGGRVILDGRSDVPTIVTLDDLEAAVLVAAETLLPETGLPAVLEKTAAGARAPSSLDAALARLDARGVLVRRDDRLLSLAIDLDRYRTDGVGRQPDIRRAKMHGARTLLAKSVFGRTEPVPV